MRLGKDGKVELIRKVPLFSKLSKSGLREVASLADELDFPAGKTLIREGERGREFFVLLDGKAEVERNGRRIDLLEHGDFFGEIALVRDVPRTATVTTATPARALVITDRDFKALLRHSPQISRGVIEALAERVAHDLS